MRLIDADALREEYCKECNAVTQDICNTDPICCSMMWVFDAATVDAVEVVRCRDCKYYKEGELLAPEKFCFRLMHPTENRRIGYNFADDDFCSYGERKADG